MGIITKLDSCVMLTFRPENFFYFPSYFIVMYSWSNTTRQDSSAKSFLTRCTNISHADTPSKFVKKTMRSQECTSMTSRILKCCAPQLIEDEVHIDFVWQHSMQLVGCWKFPVNFYPRWNSTHWESNYRSDILNQILLNCFKTHTVKIMSSKHFTYGPIISRLQLNVERLPLNALK